MTDYVYDAFLSRHRKFPNYETLVLSVVENSLNFQYSNRDARMRLSYQLTIIFSVCCVLDPFLYI